MSKNKLKQTTTLDIQPERARVVAQPAPESKFNLNQKLALLLGIIAFLVYANTLQNGFAYDDLSAITKNTIVAKGISGIPEILSTPYRHGYWIVPNDTYRPLSLVLFATEYQFFGKNPAPGHFVNILLYAVCVILLFSFFNALLEQKKTSVAFVAALLFALHPIHTEVVANIKSCDELLCFLFAFLSLNIFLKYQHTGKITQLLAGSICFLLALLSKETVISFTGIILLVFLFYRNENRQRSLYICAGSIVSVILFFAIRTAVLNAYHIDQFANIPFIDNALVKPGLPVASRLASAILILGYYIKLLFVPYPLIMDYSYNHIPLTTFSDPLVLVSLALYIFLFVFSIRRFLHNRKDPWAFCIFWFLITISLYSNTFMLIAATLGERFLFFPSVAFCLLLALLLEKYIVRGAGEGTIWFLAPKALAMFVPLAVIYAGLAYSRNTDWAGNLTLYSADVKKAPESVKLNYLLGMQFLNDAKEEKNPAKQKPGMDQGINYLSKSIAIYPDYDDAQSEICGAFFRSGRYDSADVHGKLSLHLNPINPYTLNNMGGIAFMRKDYQSTISLCEKAISIQPGIVDMYTNVAASFLSLNRTDSGLAWCYKAIRVDSTYQTTYQFLITAFRAAGRPDSAAKYEAMAKRIAAGM